MNIDKIAKRIEDARTAYYGPGQPIMTDAEYDALEDELRRLDPDHWMLRLVGAPPGDSGWPKVRHAIPMGSLNKAQTSQEMTQWFRKLGSSPGILWLTEKLDGISVSCRYSNGKFIQAISRGDGVTGEDITRNVSLMKGIQKNLTGNYTSWSGWLRGEIVCLKSDHAKHFPGQSNPRNTASGTAKRESEPEKCKYLTVKLYQVLPDGKTFATKLEELMTAKEMGFQVPHSAQCGDLDKVELVYQRYVKASREMLDYDIDGLVIEVNDVATAEALGELNGRPKGAIAYKFPHDEKETILEDVIWQVGNTGRLTPVAIFKPVVLAGATVTRASLHTAKKFEELKLKVGDRILVCRRGDVIPYVEANLDA